MNDRIIKDLSSFSLGLTQELECIAGSLGLLKSVDTEMIESKCNNFFRRWVQKIATENMMNKRKIVWLSWWVQKRKGNQKKLRLIAMNQKEMMYLIANFDKDEIEEEEVFYII